MKRIDFDDNIGAVEDKFGAGKDGWTNGDPEDPSTGTVPQDYWFDSVQEELAQVLEGLGKTLNGGQFDQVFQALEERYLPRGGSGVATSEMGLPIIYTNNFAATDSSTPRLQDHNIPTHAMKLWISSATPAGELVRLYVHSGGVFLTRNRYWNEGTSAWVDEDADAYGLAISPTDANLVDPGADATISPHTVPFARGRIVVGGGALAVQSGSKNVNSIEWLVADSRIKVGLATSAVSLGDATPPSAHFSTELIGAQPGYVFSDGLFVYMNLVNQNTGSLVDPTAQPDGGIGSFVLYRNPV